MSRPSVTTVQSAFVGQFRCGFDRSVAFFCDRFVAALNPADEVALRGFFGLRAVSRSFTGTMDGFWLKRYDCDAQGDQDDAGNSVDHVRS